jgi:prepilin-type N-terminal cleavage/methylation domain-containing protein
MRSHGNQSGFSIVEVVIVLAVLGFVGLLGYTAYNRVNDSKTANNSQSATASDVKSAPAINSTSDLDSAQATLEQTDPSAGNGTDTSQLDNELSAF